MRLNPQDLEKIGEDTRDHDVSQNIAVGLEGAARLAVVARAHSGGEVWQQDFLRLDLPHRHFHGVFANAALFHVPSQDVAARVAAIARRPETGYRSAAGFVELTHYYRPAGLPRAQQPWLASVWRKSA